MKNVFLVLFLMFICTACSEDTNEKPSEAVTIDGTVAMGEIQSGTLKVYDYSQCTKGGALAQTTLNQSNNFSLTTGARDSDTPLLFELSNYQYKEQWSDEIVDAADNKLYAVAVLTSGERSINVTLSFWTMLAAGYAEENCMSSTPDAVNNVKEANQIFSDVLDADILEDTPIYFPTLESPPFNVRELTNARYGIANMAVASYTYDLDVRNGESTHHVSFNTAMFAQFAYSDIVFEGFLDGVNQDGSMELGTLAVNADTYRTAIPNHMDAIINSLTNLPEGMDANFLTGIVSKVHSSSDTGIFGFSPVEELGDLTAPVLASVSVSQCSAPIVGSCCGGLFSDPENLYGNTALLEFNVEDLDSDFQVSVLHVGTTDNTIGAGIESSQPLAADITNSSIPWRSNLRPRIQVSQVSTVINIPSVTVVFTNRFDQELSVTYNVNPQSCTAN